MERDRYGRPIPRGRSGGDRMMDDRGSRDGDRDGYGRGGGGGGGGGVGFNTYGLSPQFLDSLGIVGPLSNRVFVANVSIHCLICMCNQKSSSVKAIGNICCCFIRV